MVGFQPLNHKKQFCYLCVFLFLSGLFLLLLIRVLVLQYLVLLCFIVVFVTLNVAQSVFFVFSLYQNT